MNKINWSTKALKQLKKVDLRYKSKIMKEIGKLKSFPQVELDIKKLKVLENSYRIRIGFYRVVFSVENGTPKIIKIEQILKRDNRTY